MMTLTAFCFLLIVALAAAQPRLQCGEDTYNPRTDKCCGSKISPLQFIIHPKCCGKTVYNKATEKCCKGNLFNIEDIKHPACCESELYDMAVERCCQDVVYDPTTHQCQDDTSVVARPEPINIDVAISNCGTEDAPALYDPQQEKCCRGNIHSIGDSMHSPKCCGKTLFDCAHQICCGKTIFGLGDNIVNPRCCGPAMYDQAFQMCCDKVLSDISQMDLPKCCGSSAYDSATNDCVDSVVTPKTEGPGPGVCSSGACSSPACKEMWNMEDTTTIGCYDENLFIKSITFNHGGDKSKNPDMTYQCCADVEELHAGNQCTQHTPTSEDPNVECPGNTFANMFCFSGTRNNCLHSSMFLNCCNLLNRDRLGVLQSTLVRDTCRELDGSDLDGQGGSVTCGDGEFLAGICQSDDQSCNGGKNSISAKCCTVKKV